MSHIALHPPSPSQIPTQPQQCCPNRTNHRPNSPSCIAVRAMHRARLPEYEYEQFAVTLPTPPKLFLFLPRVHSALRSQQNLHTEPYQTHPHILHDSPFRHNRTLHAFLAPSLAAAAPALTAISSVARPDRLTAQRGELPFHTFCSLHMCSYAPPPSRIPSTAHIVATTPPTTSHFSRYLLSFASFT